MIACEFIERLNIKGIWPDIEGGNIMKVKDLMIPIDEYATVGQDDTLIDVIKALEISKEKLFQNPHLH